MPPHFRRAGEGDLVHVGVLDEQLPRFPVAGDHVEDARGQAGILRQLGERESGERRELGGLEDDRAPGGERGSDFPGDHQQREIPRDDLPDDSRGPVPRELRFQQLRPAGVMVEVAGDERDVDVARFANRLAIIEALQHGEQARMLLHRPRQRVQVARSRVTGEARPGLKRGAGRGHCRAHIGRARLDDARQLGAGRRIDDVEAAPVLPLHPAAAHVQAELAAVPGDPLQRRLIGLRRRAVCHRFEDLADTGRWGHSRLTASGGDTPPSSARWRSARAGARCR